MFVDGTTIVGDGLVTDIFTTCKCSASFNDESLVAAGVSNSVVSQVKTKLTALGKRLGMVNHIESVDADEIYVTTVFNYRYSCGGTAKNSTPVTVCKSRLFNHSTADIVASYMSDGSTSSVALKFVVIREIKEKGNMTFVHQSLKNVLGVSARPQTIYYNSQFIHNIGRFVIPSSSRVRTRISLYPLLWWTTTKLQSISPPLIATGVETMWAMLLRIGFQRTMDFAARMLPIHLARSCK